MNKLKTLALLAMLGTFPVSCGGSGGTPSQSQESSKIWMGFAKTGQIIFYRPGYPLLFPSLPLTSLNQTSPQNVTTDTSTTPASTVQNLITGTVEISGFSGGTIKIEARAAEACNQGYCAVEGKSPLASILQNNPGYFSIVVPSQGQMVTLVGTYTKADQSTQVAQVYIGVLDKRVDDVKLTF